MGLNDGNVAVARWLTIQAAWMSVLSDTRYVAGKLCKWIPIPFVNAKTLAKDTSKKFADFEMGYTPEGGGKLSPDDNEEWGLTAEQKALVYEFTLVHFNEPIGAWDAYRLLDLTSALRGASRFDRCVHSWFLQPREDAKPEEEDNESRQTWYNLYSFDYLNDLEWQSWRRFQWDDAMHGASSYDATDLGTLIIDVANQAYNWRNVFLGDNMPQLGCFIIPKM